MYRGVDVESGAPGVKNLRNCVEPLLPTVIGAGASNNLFLLRSGYPNFTLL